MSPRKLERIVTEQLGKTVSQVNIMALHTHHDAAITIISGGKIKLNMELERYSRVKHDYGFRYDFIDYCLRKVGMSIDDIDIVCTNPAFKFPELRPGTVMFPGDVPEPAGKDSTLFPTAIGGKSLIGITVNHHLAHMASSFLTSPFKTAALLCVDGGGDTPGVFSIGIGQDNRVDALIIDAKAVPVCGWWKTVTHHNYRMPIMHELDSGFGAGKIMALAAYGYPEAQMEARLRGQVMLSDVGIAKTFENGETLSYNGYHGYDFGKDLSDTQDNESKNLAACLQKVTEEVVTSSFQAARDLTGRSDICFSGGLALNCIASSNAIRVLGNGQLFVPPCPNDAGIALGMALYTWHCLLGMPREEQTFFSPYNGPQYSTEDIVAAVAASGMPAERFSNDSDLIERVGSIIADGHISCQWRNRSESGPRALGHRSFVCRPDISNIRERMNAIKKREWYRPFAPIILDTAADELLIDGLGLSQYMTTSATIRPEWKSRLAGVTHVDGTTRPQVLTQEMDAYLYRLINCVHKKTGIPAILNTSFNINEPMVETPDQAIDTWRRSKCKHLFLEDFILTRPD